MRANYVFCVTVWIAIVAVWMVSGEQFLDLVFAMPDAGPIDDWVIAAAFGLEDIKAVFAPPDMFAQLRGVLHSWMGL